MIFVITGIIVIQKNEFRCIIIIVYIFGIIVIFFFSIHIAFVQLHILKLEKAVYFEKLPKICFLDNNHFSKTFFVEKSLLCTQE